MAADEILDSSNAPLVSGADSVQTRGNPEESKALVPLAAVGGIAQMPLTDALRDIRQIRGEAAMSLLLVHANRLEYELQSAKREREHSQERCEHWMNLYYKANERGLVLQTRLRGLTHTYRIQHFVGVIGGIVLGVSIPFLITGPGGWAITTTILGALLLVTGFWPYSQKEPEQ